MQSQLDITEAELRDMITQREKKVEDIRASLKDIQVGLWNTHTQKHTHSTHTHTDTHTVQRRDGTTHVSFIVTRLEDEFLRVVLPVLHWSGRGGLVGRTQRDWLAPLALL